MGEGGCNEYTISMSVRIDALPKDGMRMALLNSSDCDGAALVGVSNDGTVG